MRREHGTIFESCLRQIGRLQGVERSPLHQHSMFHRILAVGLKVATAFVVLFGASVQIAVAQPAERLVPKAECGPTDRAEAVQGRVTLAERFAPGPAKAFNCNLELVSQHKGPGTGWGMATYDRCAYYDVRLRRDLPQPARPGTIVVDVSDSRNLKATSIDDLINVNESMAIAPARQLMVSQYWTINQNLPVESHPPLEVWDVSDCSRPERISSQVLPGFRHHYGSFPADGLTFYTASCCLDQGIGLPGAGDLPVSAVYAIDLSDPKQPRELTRWIPPDPKWSTHATFVNEAGTRVYAAFMGDTANTVNGFAILDSSDIKARRPNAQFRLIQSMFWDDSSYSQMALPFRSKGQDYLLFTDFSGRRSGGGFDSRCTPGLTGWGHARFINVSDDHKPQLASKLMLEVNDPARCASTLQDPVAMGYGSSWCGFDRPTDPRLLACAWLEGGLRVFDVRDVANPREVAYYKPPATRTEARPGAYLRIEQDGMGIHTADSVAATPRFGSDGKEIWFTSFDNGFQVVRFSDRFIAANRELFD